MKPMDFMKQTVYEAKMYGAKYKPYADELMSAAKPYANKLMSGAKPTIKAASPYFLGIAGVAAADYLMSDD